MDFLFIYLTSLLEILESNPKNKETKLIYKFGGGGGGG